MSIDSDLHKLTARFNDGDQWVALLVERQVVQLDGIFTAPDLRQILDWLEAMLSKTAAKEATATCARKCLS